MPWDGWPSSTTTGRSPGDSATSWTPAPDRRRCTAADKTTRLGLRTNRPRVYIIAGLAGGTGSGMFIDLAYAIHRQLRQLGYAMPEVVGLFFLPTVEANRNHPMLLGNAYAAADGASTLQFARQRAFRRNTRTSSRR